MSQNGKGSARRVGENPKAFAEGYERIFGKKKRSKAKAKAKK